MDGGVTIVPAVGDGPVAAAAPAAFATPAPPRRREEHVLDVAIAPPPAPPASVERLFALASADMAGVDALIRARLDSDIPLIPALGEHLVEAGGKRLRPLLTIAAARLCGGGGENAHRLAAAVEFIHTATLLHDDVVDGSKLRRGKVAAHLIWGGAASVLVGDFLFARAFELMVETGALQALNILARASRIIAEGEVLQLTRAHDLDLDQPTYLEIIRGKTAELFAASAESGAVVAGGSPAQVRALSAYGLSLGLAFQLADDALDYGGASETLGKNAGDDFREGKVTLPLLLAIARSGAGEAAFWRRAVGDRDQSDADFRRARDLIAATGALADTLSLARDHAEAAKAELRLFSRGEWRASLEALADFAAERTA